MFLRFFTLIVLALILLGLHSRFSLAAFLSGIEAENATLAGASIGNDIEASGGKYIQFGSRTTQSLAFQPSAPYYATFFYMWYKNPNTDNGWSYWTDIGSSPPSTWFSHYLPDPDPAVFNPTSELYSSNNYENFKWQVSKMAEARQEIAIGSWWGQNRKEDDAFNNIINSFMGRSDNPYPNLRWTLYYENEGFGDPDVATLVSDLTYIRDKYSQSPYFFKINGKPVIFVYGGSSDGPGTMLSRWSQANAQLNDYFYYVPKLFSGYATASPQPNSWHQYAPAVRSGQHGSFSFYVSPGFWLDDGSAERLTRDSTSFENAVRNMVAANTTWKLVQTWNEWGEGTSVEPGEQVTYNSTTGNNEPYSGYEFKNLYVDILARNLPPLEQGSGSQ